MTTRNQRLFWPNYPIRRIVRPVSVERFNLLNLRRDFSLISLSGFTIAAALLLVFGRQQATQDMISTTEAHHVVITQILSNILSPEYEAYLYSVRSLSNEALLTDATLRRVSEEMAAHIKGTTLTKVKVFDLNGRTVLSTGQSQPGSDSNQSLGFLKAKSGQIHNRSQEGKGTEFIIELPVQIAQLKKQCELKNSAIETDFAAHS